jgi:di/tripeptidase
LCEICSISSSQEIEKAYKALRLNGDVSRYYPYGSNDYNPKLLGASSTCGLASVNNNINSNSKKPIIHIKRLKFRHSPYNIRLRGASLIQKRLQIERENADKALSPNFGF